MPRHRLSTFALVLVALVSGCPGQVVEGTGAATSGEASSGGTSGEAPTSAAPTTAGPTTAEPTSAGPTTDEPTSAGPSSGEATPGTTGPADTGSETGSPGTDTGVSSSGGDAVCGNGEAEPGELCDDGNPDEADGCTTLCRAPKHCLELLMLAPGTANETYEIDPEGDGAPFKAYCDMEGGGWTQVYYDEFNAKDGWSAGEITECGELGKVLGGAGQFGNDASTEKQIDLLHVEHAQIRVIAELAIIDSWDDEPVFAEVDGQEVAKKSCKHWDANTCGQNKNQCGGGYSDGNTNLAGDHDHAMDTALVKFHADLNENATNEAWGLDTMYVFVK